MTIDIQCQGGQVLGGHEWTPGAGDEEGRFGNSVWGTRGQTVGQSDYSQQVTTIVYYVFSS